MYPLTQNVPSLGNLQVRYHLNLQGSSVELGLGSITGIKESEIPSQSFFSQTVVRTLESNCRD